MKDRDGGREVNTIQCGDWSVECPKIEPSVTTMCKNERREQAQRSKHSPQPSDAEGAPHKPAVAETQYCYKTREKHDAARNVVCRATEAMEQTPTRGDGRVQKAILSETAFDRDYAVIA